MKIAVLSDAHDHLHHLQQVLDAVGLLEIDALLFLGDFCAPFTLETLAQGFAGPIHAVFGNNDGDTFLLCQVAAKHPHVQLHHPLAELELDGLKIALHHYPELGRRLAESGAYDAVFSGHDHQRYQHQIGGTLWGNPGEIMGRFGTVSFGLFDTEKRTFEHRTV